MLSRKIIVVLLAAGTIASYADTKKDSQYATLLARVKGGDTKIDFQQMRLAYMDSPEYQAAKDTDAESKAMIAAINAKDFPAAIKNADVVLANDYVDMDAHFVEYIANRELHHDPGAAFHKSVFDGLLKSITGSADGKTEQTAYVVISTHEEYVLLRVFGLVPEKQSLSHSGHHSYDVLEAKDPNTDQTITLFFNVDIPMKHFQ
jgi:hypothetical protein